LIGGSETNPGLVFGGFISTLIDFYRAGGESLAGDPVLRFGRRGALAIGELEGPVAFGASLSLRSRRRYRIAM
jgi:hypothetical protein